jgi:hypothetical protein
MTEEERADAVARQQAAIRRFLQDRQNAEVRHGAKDSDLG